MDPEFVGPHVGELPGSGGAQLDSLHRGIMKCLAACACRSPCPSGFADLGGVGQPPAFHQSGDLGELGLSGGQHPLLVSRARGDREIPGHLAGSELSGI